MIYRPASDRKLEKNQHSWKKGIEDKIIKEIISFWFVPLYFFQVNAFIKNIIFFKYYKNISKEYSKKEKKKNVLSSGFNKK